MKTFHLEEMRRSVKTLADETREMREIHHGTKTRGGMK